MFDWYLWETCFFFPKGNEGGVDLEDRGEHWGEATKSRGRENCAQDVMYERRKKKEIIVTTNVWTSVSVVSFIIIYICPMFKSFSKFTTFFFKHLFSLHLSICVHTLAFTGTVCYSIWEWKNKFQKSVFSFPFTVWFLEIELGISVMLLLTEPMLSTVLSPLK